MIPLEQIKQGHAYRFRDSQTIWLILSVWEAQQEAEVVVFENGMFASDETKRWPFSQLASWFSEEVEPSWKSVPGLPLGWICREKTHHVFPDIQPDSLCEVCGITLAVAAGKVYDKERAEEEAAAAAEKKPVVGFDASAWLNNISGE